MNTSPLPTLRTDRLTLRPFLFSDAADVQRLAGVREVAATTLNIPHPYEDGMAEEWIGAHGAQWEARSHMTLAVTTDAAGLLGAIGLHLSMAHRRAEMGYWIGKPFWNRGYATEAARAVLGFGFTDLRLNRIDAHFLSVNAASGRVMEKLGMKHEGVLRQHIVKWGDADDIVLYGILASEFAGSHE